LFFYASGAIGVFNIDTTTGIPSEPVQPVGSWRGRRGVPLGGDRYAIIQTRRGLRYVVDLLGLASGGSLFISAADGTIKIFLLRFDVSGLWREMSLDEEGSVKPFRAPHRLTSREFFQRAIESYSGYQDKDSEKRRQNGKTLTGLPRDPVLRAALIVFLVAAVGLGGFFCYFYIRYDRIIEQRFRTPSSAIPRKSTPSRARCTMATRRTQKKLPRPCAAPAIPTRRANRPSAASGW